MRQSRPIGWSSACARGFTLVELLVVMMIMLLILGLVLPAIRAISGSRSNEVAYNEISAVLQNARLRAIGLVQETGIMFYLDPQTQLTAMTMVYTTPSLTNDPQTTESATLSPVDHLVDLVPNQTVETLPSGIGFQTINTAYGQAFGTSYHYNGFVVSPNGLNLPFFGGLILFDGQGHVLKVPWGCRVMTESNEAVTSAPSPIGQLIFNTGSQAGNPSPNAPNASYIPPLNTGSSGGAPITNFVFTLYDQDAYNTYIAQNQATPLTASTANDNWLMGNSSANPPVEGHGLEVLLNGYDGTLLKSE